MLIQELFSRGIMKMGPSRVDPNRQVGVFNPDFVSGLPALRAAEMEKFRWIAGEWSHENEVPATAISPAYSDIGSSRFSFNKNSGWINLVAANEKETPYMTFDPYSKQWIYVLIQGSYGILRSTRGWVGEQIVFSGLMTMIGINCEWRMTWTREGTDQFSFINEEQNEDGSWAYIDQWRFVRKQ